MSMNRSILRDGSIRPGFVTGSLVMANLFVIDLNEATWFAISIYTLQ